MKIGAQYFTIRDYCKKIEDFETSCKKASEMGYRYVQLSCIGEFSAEEIKPIMDAYGLQTVCTHRSPDKYLEHIEDEIVFHKTLGCKICGLGSMPGFKTTPDPIGNFSEKFRPVAARLAEEGLIFAYHNHAFEFEKTADGKFVFDKIFESMASDNFRVILDVYWLSYAGINPADFIRKYSDKIACVHFKDMKIVDSTQKFAEVGYGNLNWKDIAAACHDAGIEYALVEQDSCDGDPFESLKKSYDYIKAEGLAI